MAVVIVPERDKIDSVRFVIETGKLVDDATVEVAEVVIGIMVVPVEVVVVMVVRVASAPAAAEAIDDVVADVVVVVAVAICDSLVSIFCFGSVVNIGVADDDDSCAVTVVVAMDDDDVDVNDGCLISNVG